MGLFDSIYVDCPHCGKPVEFQTKADEAPYMRRYTLNNAPAYMLADVMLRPTHCRSCDKWMALVDPRFPPDTGFRPNLESVKIKAPDNPHTHFQGFKWWPKDRPFTNADILKE